jgi:hypothetical protein
MGYAAFSLFILGFAVGAVLRLRVLLAVVALLLPVSLAFSLAHGFGFRDTLMAITVAQTILQSSYFLGMVARAFFATDHRTRPILRFR